MTTTRIRGSRWWWLVVSFLVSVVAVGVLYGLYVRQREARQNEQIVRVYSAQLNQAISDLVPIGAELLGSDPALLTKIIRDGVDGGIKRADALRAIDPEAAEELISLLSAARDGVDGSIINQLALLGVSADVQKVINGLADEQEARADRAALQALLGSIGALTLAVLLVAALLTRERRAWVAAAQQHADEIRQLADHDGLTGLPNRRRFDAVLDELAKRQQPPGGADARAGAVEIALCDLNGFKAINDRLGHHAGDAVLVSTADALVAAVGQAGTVYRIGGDEFCVISEPGRQVGDLLREAFERHGEPPAGAVGVASWPVDADALEDVVRLADHRMYDAKRAVSPAGFVVAAASDRAA